MAFRKEAILSWVIVDGNLRHVSDFSQIRPSLRPSATCPVCAREVIMRLGNERIFHAAHKPEDSCVVTRPETARHLNAKLHIYRQLQKNTPLFIEYFCDGPSGSGCLYLDSRKIRYLDGWDEVKVEYKIDQYRPDIVLLMNGIAIGAVEVFVTHAIEPEKEQYLQKLSIPWIEVAADDVLPRTNDDQGWIAEKPIDFMSLNTLVIKKWICAKCKVEDEEQKRELIREEIAKQYMKTAFKIVDFYYPDRKHHRSIFYAEKRVIDNSIVEIRIIDGERIVCLVKDPNLPDDQKKLTIAFDKHLNKYKERGYHLDSHMKWQTWDNGGMALQYLDDSIDSLFPKRFYWSYKTKTWEPWFVYKSLNWNEYFADKNKYLKAKTEKWQKLIQFRNRYLINS